MKKPILLMMTAFGCFLCRPLPAAPAPVPETISYQGVVRVNGIAFTGTGQFKFAIVENVAGGASLWSNDGASVNGSPPAAAVTLPVTNGFFQVLLGDGSLANMQSIPPNIFGGQPNTLLRVWFNDGPHGWVQLGDTRLASVPYAMSAFIAPGSITGSQVANGTIDPSKLLTTNAPQTGYVLGYDPLGKFAWLNMAPANNAWLNGANGIYYNGGNVGVGASDPAHRLGIAGGPLWTGHSWKGAVALENTAAIGWAANAGGQRFGMGHSGGGFYMFRTASDLGDPWSPALYDFAISDSGKVGIGTTTPGTKLTVQTDLNVGQYGIEHTDGAVRLATYINNGGGWLGTISNDRLNFFVNNGSESMTIDTVGKVGIGTGAPVANLHLHGGINSVSQRISTSGGTNSWTRLEFVNNNGQWNVGTSQSYNGNQFYFRREGASDNAFAIQPNGDVFVQGTMSCKVLTITGADLAEKFPSTDARPEPGTVMEIDPEHPGQLRIARGAYCDRVAGVVSGAGDLSAGAVLGNLAESKDGPPIALSGRVWVQCDAAGAPIVPGDMLTTSDKPGHAMRAADRNRAQGAILGKAMTKLDDGQGLVLVLVTLQ